MLKQRVLTAIVLFAVLAIVMSAQSLWPFYIFLSCACGLAGWEWTRLTLPSARIWPITIGLALFLITLIQAVAWLVLNVASLIWVQICVVISVLIWFICVSTALYRSRVHEPLAQVGWSVFAIITLFATWGVLALLYREHGVLYVLSLLAMIWIADIVAYFVGRAIGRRKLAPAISPGKTLEGALAGVVGVMIWVWLSAQWSGSFGAALVSQWGVLVALLLAVLLAVFSIAGDLFESLLKRRAGVKDSSHLLPGHGGVYDRIDAVVSVVPLAYLLTMGVFS